MLLLLLLLMMMMMNKHGVLAQLIAGRWVYVRNNLWMDLLRVHGHVISDATVELATRGRHDWKYSKCRSTSGWRYFLVSGSINLHATQWRHIKAKVHLVTMAMRWRYRCNQGTCTQWHHTMSSAINDVAKIIKCHWSHYRLHLLESFTLCWLTYGLNMLFLHQSQLKKLNSCWNSKYRRIFGFCKWESVKEIQLLCKRLDLVHLIDKFKLLHEAVAERLYE